HDRGLVEYNPLALHIDERIGCSEIDRDVRAKKAEHVISAEVRKVLMLKMSHAAHNERHAPCFGGGNDVGVTHGAARFDRRNGTGIGAGLEAVGERKERIAGHEGAVKIEPMPTG